MPKRLDLNDRRLLLKVAEPFQQANAKSVLEIGHVPTDTGSRHFEAARSFRKAFGLDDFCEHDHGIEISHFTFPIMEKFPSGLMDNEALARAADRLQRVPQTVVNGL
jgi:hypothetical protein